MWLPPFKNMSYRLTSDSESFLKCPPSVCEIPINPHPGSFAFKRRHHTHEGIDFYVKDGTRVYALEDGKVVGIENFTGPKAGSDWWHDTMALLVEGQTGVIVYGEIRVNKSIKLNQEIKKGQYLGIVKQVLKKDKGRPMSMLHLELHKHGTKKTYEWEGERPSSLLDPTPHCIYWLHLDIKNNLKKTSKKRIRVNEKPPKC